MTLQYIYQINKRCLDNLPSAEEYILVIVELVIIRMMEDRVVQQPDSHNNPNEWVM